MQQLQGQFASQRGVPLGGGFQTLNLTDAFNGGAPTAGAQLIFALTATPTVTKPWTVYAWGVQLFGVFAPIPFYGRLGRILTSLVIDAGLPAGVASFAPPPGAALPNLVEMWDGSRDAAFPQVPATVLGPGSFLQVNQQLPQPQQVIAGQQLAVGLWLTPSLIDNYAGQGGTFIALFNASWSILYE